MNIPKLYLFSFLVLCLLLITFTDAKKKKKNTFGKKKHGKKASAPAAPPPPQDPIPHGIYTQTGNCFCPIGGSSTTDNDSGDD